MKIRGRIPAWVLFVMYVCMHVCVYVCDDVCMVQLEDPWRDSSMGPICMYICMYVCVCMYVMMYVWRSLKIRGWIPACAYVSIQTHIHTAIFVTSNVILFAPIKFRPTPPGLELSVCVRRCTCVCMCEAVSVCVRRCTCVCMCEARRP